MAGHDDSTRIQSIQQMQYFDRYESVMRPRHPVLDFDGSEKKRSRNIIPRRRAIASS